MYIDEKLLEKLPALESDVIPTTSWRKPQLLYNQLSHLDNHHFVIIECRHLANGCVLQCGCIGLMLFHNLSCLDTIICYINTIGIVPAYACNVWLPVVQPLANVQEAKWTPHVKREIDVAQSYILALRKRSYLDDFPATYCTSVFCLSYICHCVHDIIFITKLHE